LPTKIDAPSIVSVRLAPLAGKRILDVGCGAGILARSLSEEGARVTGVDPNAVALAAARRAVPTGKFHRVGAEELPFAEGCFDGVIFLNSLHHVPQPSMHQALLEAARVVKPARPVIVMEPLAEGSFFYALRPVEDETDVRTTAQEVLRRALERGIFQQLDRTDYLRREHFAGLDQFLSRILAVDPTRAAAVANRRSEVEAAFRRYARVTPDGRMTLDQPMRVHVLAPTAGVRSSDPSSTGPPGGRRPPRRPVP
jgi:ubiquinone/menaquinone biosynthesis C-methylase UbiE